MAIGLNVVLDVVNHTNYVLVNADNIVTQCIDIVAITILFDDIGRHYDYIGIIRALWDLWCFVIISQILHRTINICYFCPEILIPTQFLHCIGY